MLTSSCLSITRGLVSLELVWPMLVEFGLEKSSNTSLLIARQFLQHKTSHQVRELEEDRVPLQLRPAGT